MGTSSTLKLVAEKLNVSVSTVSRVANDKKCVKDATRQKVLEALREYHYVPNEIARSLKIRESKTIGVILPDICEVFFGAILRGIDSILSPQGYTLIVADTNESRENEARSLNVLYQKRVDALVLATVSLTDRRVLRYLDNGIPVVFIDNLPRLNRPVDSVTIDNVAASKLALRYLMANGHRRIAIIAGSMEETTGHDRYRGYDEAMREAGIRPEASWVLCGHYKERDGYRCMKTLLENREKAPFTAVYVTSEMMTFGAVKAIREQGLRIPEDLSLVGFDVHDKAGLVTPSIATVRQPEQQIGVRTGELLLERLTRKDMPLAPEMVLLDASFVVGNSVRRLDGGEGEDT